MKKILLTIGAVMFLSAPLQAATLGLTEGKRALVDGTVALAGPDSPNDANGYALGTVGYGAGELTEADIHGRIVDQADFYNFTATADFIIEFIFDDVFVNAVEIVSGFIREGNNDNRSDFVLDLNGSAVGSSPVSYITDITSDADNGGTSVIFSGVAGTLYTFAIDSRPDVPSYAATYDVRISAVPLPAGGLLLIGALGALGVARRRKS